MAQTGLVLMSGRVCLGPVAEQLPDEAEWAQRTCPKPRDGGSAHTVLWYRTLRWASAALYFLGPGQGQEAKRGAGRQLTLRRIAQKWTSPELGQAQSWVQTGKERQVFAGDLEAWPFRMSSCAKLPSGFACQEPGTAAPTHTLAGSDTGGGAQGIQLGADVA